MQEMFYEKTQEREAWVDITHKVQNIIKNSGVQNGIVNVFIPHTTAGVTINENADPDVKRDLTAGLKRIVPFEQEFLHLEGNSDAHLKASLMGFSCTVPLQEGRLCLGTWQSIYLAEFDGARTRKVIVTIL